MLRNSIEIIQEQTVKKTLSPTALHIFPLYFFASAYFSVNYRLYKHKRNLSYVLLLSVFLIKENIEGNLTHVLFQVDNDTEVDVYRANGLHGKIYEVSNC